MKPPVFVVGTMRSGSTLLRLILDSHESIAIGEETGFMGALSATTAIPGFKYGREWFTRIGWSAEELDDRLREFYGGMFERYAAEQGKDRWGDKTPFHTMHMAEMARVFPQASFIGIVRHPGAVSTSLRDKFHYDFADAVRYWVATNTEMLVRAAELGERFALCRYEDLVRTPEPVTRELMSWMGETWSPGLLEHHKVQREKGAPKLVDGSTSTRDAIDADRADQWRAAVSTTELLALAEEASPLASFFGYDTRGEVHDLPTARARGIASGGDVAMRMQEWSSRVDFTVEDRVIDPGVSKADLLARAQRAEAALKREKARRAVRVAEAMRRVRRQRSLGAAQGVVRAIRGTDRVT